MQTTIATSTAMNDFDAATARRDLTRSVALTILSTAAALAAILFLLGNRPDHWRGYAAASVAAALAAALSLIPLRRGLTKGFSAFVPAVMAATGVRTLVAVGGCVLAITAGDYPPAPTLMLMMPYYLALLGVESAFFVKLAKR